ncbi:hypothetical protein DF157_29170 [Burkholderia cenocepacia]|uniref:Uncharacterized protein n=2 Tax=Burkholderia cepacia complex TaxID=87882 RepID=A0A3N9DW53_9BURK|nr:conserved hypothetical protein [Burkholderia cenocepacia HI2424]AQQ29441.1 hypothetical protein A8E88_29265 [Burkholderia cenocepacia]AQQ33912.1 hypothetical protein A8E96_16570 [Burkholderia cenocepacia]AWG31652.1 hypothetical protein B9Z07_22950 [Burkholderia cenocepacia]ONV79294.1 hypothetical protein A8E89_34255 [Burkholderia cenocepacia]
MKPKTCGAAQRRESIQSVPERKSCGTIGFLRVRSAKRRTCFNGTVGTISNLNLRDCAVRSHTRPTIQIGNLNDVPPCGGTGGPHVPPSSSTTITFGAIPSRRASIPVA